MLRAAHVAAFYLDVLTCLTLFGLLTSVFGLSEQIGSIAPIAAAVAIAAIMRWRRVSLGSWLVNDIVDLAAAGGAPRRVWINLGVGVLCYLEATKQLVRWTTMDRPMPFMGVIPEGGEQVLLDLAWGVVFLAAAVLVLQLRRAGKMLAVGAQATLLISTAVSWDVFPEAIERSLIARRAAQGLPVREGEIEAMQSGFPTFLAASVIVLLIIAALVYVRDEGRRRVAV